MNGYYIFVIVVSLALAIYYFTLIQIDLHKLKRSKDDAEENISADGSIVDDAPIVPKVVKEGANGEVSISASEHSQSEDPMEAEDDQESEKSDTNQTETESESRQTESANDSEAESDSGRKTEDEDGHNDQRTEYENNDEQNPENDSASDEEGQGQAEGTETAVPEAEAEGSEREEADEAETPPQEDGLEVLNITPDTVETETKDDESTDASSAFDASLIQPQFGVQQMVGPQASPEAIQKAALVNESLMKNRARGRIEHSSEVVKNLIKNAELSKTHNIATHDEISRF